MQAQLCLLLSPFRPKPKELRVPPAPVQDDKGAQMSCEKGGGLEEGGAPNRAAPEGSR